MDANNSRGVKNVKFDESSTVFNPLKTDLDQVPERDTVFASDEFNQMYNEHVRRKEEIRNRIEAMTREKHFLEQLGPSDVAYMFQKKQEYNIAKGKEEFEKKFSPKKRGESNSPKKLRDTQYDDQIIQPFDNYSLSTDEKTKLDRQKKELMQFRKFADKQDFFFDKVSEDRAKELKDKVLTIRRSERPKELPRPQEFNKKFKEFKQANQEFVQDRLQLLDKRRELEVMKNYLASDNKKMDEDPENRKRQTIFDMKISDLKCWSQINDGIDKKSWEQAEQLHNEKLEKYRFQEKYVQLIEEDEDDVEGEKIISEIQNLNAERFFNMYYIEIDLDHNEKMVQERFKGQSDLMNSMKKPKLNDKNFKK